MKRLTLHLMPAAQEAGSVLDEVEDLVKRWRRPLPWHQVTRRPLWPQIVRRSMGEHTGVPHRNFVHADGAAGSTVSGGTERRVTESGDLFAAVRGCSCAGFMTTSSPVLKCPCEVPASEAQRELTSSTGCQTPEAASGVFQNSLGRSVGQSTVHASEVA